jgi:MYXO-CTERM domain-containing protein
MCEGVTCACSHCPRDYDDCAIIPGCAQVSECFRTKDCVGQDCFDTGACRGVVNTYGGPAAPAFRAANALQSCELAFSCGLPCGDAGTGSSPDAGASICTPGKARICSCGDGGTGGEQTCNDDGSAYSDCKCHASVPKDENSSCECGLSRTGSSGAGVAAMLGLMTALLARRRKQHERHSR